MTEYRDIVGPASSNKGTDIKLYDTLSDRPTAATFGVGQCQIGSTVYVSDGVRWRIFTTATRATPLRVASFGDSTANIGSSNTDISLPTAPFPASGATVINKYGAAKYMLDSFYPQARLVANGGVSGETTAQMLARDNAASGATRKAITDVLNLYPDVVLLRGGSINDLTGVTSSTIDSTVAAALENHKNVINRLLSGGVKIVDVGVYGYSAAGATDPASTRAALVKLNKLISDYCSNFPGQVVFVSLDNIIRNTDGSYISTAISSDGIHLTTYGQFLAAQEEASALISLFGYPLQTQFKGVNICTNPLFSADTAGTATGVTFGNSGCTLANKKIEHIDGKIFQTVEVTTTGAAYVQIKLPFNATTAGIVANNTYAAEADIYLGAVNGGAMPSFSALKTRIDLYKSAAGRVVYDSPVIEASTTLPADTVLHSIIGPYQITEASANLTASSYFSLEASMESSGFTLKIGIGLPRFVAQ